MYCTKSDAAQFVEENDVKFIRLAFVDINGVQKNMSIMPCELERALNDGITFDPHQIPGLFAPRGTLLKLIPDPTTLTVLPWRPAHGRVVRFFCDIFNTDGSRYELDSRGILEKTIKKLKAGGIACTIGTECEFYLMKTDENGEPSMIPQDHAGYFDIAPDDMGENVRREICLTLEDMDISPLSSHHEAGPGQNEIDFAPGDPMKSADDVVAYRSVVRTIAAKNGLYASFAPKPYISECGSGFHLAITPKSDIRQNLAAPFAGGIVGRVSEVTRFLNPAEQSYRRLAMFDHSRLIKLDGETILLSSPDSEANPYIAYALLLNAGYEGLEDEAESAEARFEGFPENMASAEKLACESAFVRSVLPEACFNRPRR